VIDGEPSDHCSIPAMTKRHGLRFSQLRGRFCGRPSTYGAVALASWALLGAACQPDMVVAADQGPGEAGADPGTTNSSGGSGAVGAEDSGGASSEPSASGGTVVGGASSASGGVPSGPPIVGGATGLAGSGGAGTGPNPLTPIAGRSALRLRASTFAQTLATLLQVAPEDAEIPRPVRVGFDNDPSCEQAALHGPLAAAAVDSRTDEQLLEAVGCSEPGEECATAIVEGFAERAFGRPLAAGERTALLDHHATAAETSASNGIRQLVLRILSSPEAECLSSRGIEVSPTRYSLDDYEMASILSYAVTGLPPDDDLWKAAEQGGLHPSLELERLLVLPSARTHLERMIRQWVRIPDAEELWIHESEPELAASMLEETRLFIEDVVFERPAPISALLAADFSFVDGPLAELYGLPPVDEFSLVDLTATRRRGILHHASFLSASATAEHTRMTGRALIPWRFLCQEVAPPPAEAEFEPPPNDPNLTRREELAQAVTGAACAGCHRLLDDFFLSFEHFDQTGAYRETEQGLPIDTSGSTDYGGVSLEYTDSADLVEQISSQSLFNQCFLGNAVGWFVGFPLGEANDYILRTFPAGEPHELRAVLQTFVDSYQFRFRSN
jgi:hypothetical protein